jgi:AcrR family transcriptional regulator
VPAPILTKEEVLGRLMNAFREKGFDGASLAELSAATGLGKSSLYHHFPGGKVEMARQTLEYLEAALEQSLFEPMRTDESPEKKLSTMLDTLSAFYGEGRRACLLERLCASVDQRRFRGPLAKMFERWIDVVEELAREAGLPRAVAHARAEDLVVRIEGALIVCAGTGDTKIFTRTIDDLRSSLFAR